ncbi:MAG TPA: tyrosine-type recombinase/integrase [Gaiellaceae bacterium]|jgi:integrase
MNPINATEAGLRACSVCGRPRGNSRTGWTPVTHGEAVIGYVCEACPAPTEPIRRLVTKTGVRFRAVVDATPPGAHQRKQATKTLPSLPAARAWVAEVRETVAHDGTYLRSSDAATVAELVSRWLASRIGIRRVSVQGYANALRPAVSYMGKRRVSDIRKSDVQQYLAWALNEGSVRGGPLSARTVQYGWMGLAQVFDVAVGDGLLPVNPVRQVRKSELPRQRERVGRMIEHWTGDQLVRFRQQADLDSLAGVWRLSLSGLTRADLHGLRWADLDLDAGTVTIQQGRVALLHGETVIDAPKSQQRRRTVKFEAIWPGSVALLRQLRAAQAADRLAAGAAWNDSGLVIVDPLGQPSHPDRYGDRFRRIVAAAELPSIRLHALRHSLAFYMHDAGVKPADAAALLGHRVDVYLSTYLPESGTSGIENAADTLGRAIAAAG